MTSSDAVPAKPSLLERLAAVSALATSFALALSFTYDWGFFSALGIGFASAPTSISDHLRTGLLWASRLVPGVLLILVLDLLTHRIDHGLTEEENIEASPEPGRAKKEMNWPRKVIAYTSLAILIVWLITGFGRTPWFSAMICWMWFIIWVMKHPLVTARRSPMFWLFAFVGPPIMMFFFSTGSEDARSAMSHDSPVTAYIQSCEGGVETCPATTKAGVLRSFQGWLLVRDSSAVSWVRLDHVQRIDVSDEGGSSFSGLMCIFFAKCLASEKDRPLATPTTPTTEEPHDESEEGLDR